MQWQSKRAHWYAAIFVSPAAASQGTTAKCHQMLCPALAVGVILPPEFCHFEAAASVRVHVVGLSTLLVKCQVLVCIHFM